VKKLLEQYLNNLTKTLLRGDAREESYYKHLDELIRHYADVQKLNNIDVTILPKKTDAGNPDFRVWNGENSVTGYIEAKDPSFENLDAIENSEQLTRYRSTFPNVILTNFFEFRLYRDGQKVAQVNIGRPFVATKIKSVPPAENIEGFQSLFNQFFSFSLPKIRTARALAIELAKRTRFLRDEVISVELQENKGKGYKQIHGFYEAFKRYLIGTLTEKQFADLYSQTITYGLFAARTRADLDFNRRMAFDFIPHTIGILRDVFRYISLEDPPKSLEAIVDDIAEVLRITDAKRILQDYQRSGKGKDPLIHFYETFLAEYDPDIRERRGVYYTPEPVVSYIVNSIHSILKSRFELMDGLASEDVRLLDPASGTLTFPAEAIRLASNEYVGKYGEGGLKGWIKKHILNNYYSFELMMAPYAIGHLKIGYVLDELGYQMGDDERFKLYLTNTLEMEEIEQIEMPGLSSLSEESNLAGKVKKEQEILVMLGNPPYSGISANINDWTERLLKENVDGTQSYYVVDDEPLGEKKLWLQDDYVKFLRFAQWKIQKSGSGVVGMITNHGYLDNPTFRGMRQSLTKTFDEIYILDLHGNSQKNEIVPDGVIDKNVFDIRQGVAIGLFIKNIDPVDCKVYHLDLFGTREDKYNWLDESNFDSNLYSEISPESPWYFFVPRNTAHIKDYLDWYRIDDIFPINVSGIVTSRDKLAIDFDQNQLRTKILMFRNLDLPDDTIRDAFGIKDNYQWKMNEQRILFNKVENWEQNFEKILYRPFDERYIYYQDNIVFRTRYNVMRNMIKDNMGLITARSNKSDTMDHFFITNLLSEAKCGERTTQSALFPLYIYPDEEKLDLFSQVDGDRKPNIPESIISKLKSEYNFDISPEDILYYVYSVFYSNIYRQNYFEYLRIDYPRIPFPSEVELFKSMVSLGNDLADIHLLTHGNLQKPIAKYQGDGDNDRIEKIEYMESESRLYINQEKFFEGITSSIWEYSIGGYQVLDRYLKYRKGKVITDPPRICRIITAISKTIDLQNEIDKIFPIIEDSYL